MDWEALDDQVIADRVEVRMARQAVLDRRPEPLELSCVIDEMATTRQTGTPATMADQLDHLLEMSLRATIQIQIYPATSPPLHDVAFGSFRLFTSAETVLPRRPIPSEPSTGLPPNSPRTSRALR